MPRSRNLCPEAPKPGIVDFNKKMIKKRSVFERGARTLESGPPEGGRRGRDLGRILGVVLGGTLGDMYES